MPDLEPTSLIAALGWIATGVFTASYFFTRAVALRRVQMLGAALWLLYGLFLRAYPVMVANLMNLMVMLWMERRNAAKSSPPIAAEAEPPATALIRE